MKNGKKSEFITIRTNPETKEILQEMANEKRWTLSQTAAIILETYCKDRERIQKI